MKTLTLLMLFGAAIACCAQELLPSRHRLPEGGISHVQAATKAKAFLQLLDVDPSEISTYKITLQRQPRGKDSYGWRVYTGTSTMTVDALSSSVTMFLNRKRDDDRFRGRGRTGEHFTLSESVAKAHLRSIATKLGIPASLAMSKFTLKRDGDGQDSNPLGCFAGQFRNDAGQVVASLSCDLQDGVLLFYMRDRAK